MDYQANSGLDIQKAMALAATPAGQKLLQQLQSQRGAEVQTAMEQAASGDLEAAKKALAGLMASPEIRALLEQLGR